LAIALGGGSGIYFMRRFGMSTGQIALSIANLAVSLFVGAKLLYLLEAWPLSQDSWWVAIFSARLRMPGGLLLAVVLSVPLTRWMGLHYLRLGDRVIPAAGLLIVGTRIGCFLGGCCYGRPSSLLWAVRFPAGSDAYTWQVERGLLPFGTGTTVPVQPLQLYFCIVGAALFVGLIWYERHKRYDGEVLLCFALLYLWTTWLLEHLRAQPHVLTQQSVLLGAVAITAIGAVVEWRRRSRQPAILVSARDAVDQPSLL
jgi:phosphatidylglycerol:prolipoprotein diacylglycerol transferase